MVAADGTGRQAFHTKFTVFAQQSPVDAVRIIASYAMAPRFGNMTIAYAEMVSWVWLLVMYLFRLAAKKDDAL